MTERLYYHEPGLLEFEATIIETGGHNRGAYTVLDRSAFYPTSGGQLHDLGQINDLPVLDVVETKTDEVWHISAQPVGKVGDAVVGRVDPKRRTQFRQTHTAQHILSAAFHQLYGLRTESVHLGDEYGLIEFGTDSITDEQYHAAETEATRIISANLPIQILFLDREDAAKLPMRKETKREGELRLIQIGEYDCSACGGTHCSQTAEVGLIKLIAREKLRGRVGVRFLAGAQAWADYHARFVVTDQLAKSLTCHVDDLPKKVSALVEEQRALKMKLAQAEKELLPIRARTLAIKAETSGAWPSLATVISDWDQSSGDKLAALVAQEIAGWVMLLVGERLFLAVAEETGLKAGQLARELSTRCGIRGGGNDRLAQFGGVHPDQLTEYKNALVDILSHA